MKKLLSIALLSIFLYNCDKDNNTPLTVDDLPPATQTGENTFACLINGKPYIVYDTTKIAAIYQGGLLQMGGEE